ncbi:hypothetical protein ACJX0J_024911 [Zea mays]
MDVIGFECPYYEDLAINTETGDKRKRVTKKTAQADIENNGTDTDLILHQGKRNSFGVNQEKEDDELSKLKGKAGTLQTSLQEKEGEVASLKEKIELKTLSMPEAIIGL